MFIRFMFILVNAVKMRFHVIGVIVRNVIDWRTGLWHNNGGLPVDFRCFNYCVRLWKREISFDVSGLAFSFIFTFFFSFSLFFFFDIGGTFFDHYKSSLNIYTKCWNWSWIYDKISKMTSFIELYICS